MAVKPRGDHYVAQTYLRHFAGPGGMLRAYRKSDLATFPCWPRDVCKEPDGDTIPDFLSEPGFLGEFRADFEPRWTRAVEALAQGMVGIGEKQTLAGYWANLLVCTPTWRRLGVDFHDRFTTDYLEAHDALSTRIGKADPILQDGVRMLRDGRLTLNTEPNYVRAQNAVQVTRHMWRLYNATWHVLLNGTDTAYVTSDNPASFLDQGDWVGGSLPFVRYLPVAPGICLRCDLTEGYADRDEKPDFERPPRGGLRGGNVTPATVRRVNVCTAKCAENLVFTGSENDGVRRMVAKYVGFRVEGEFLKVPTRDGYYLGSRTRAIERSRTTHPGQGMPKFALPGAIKGNSLGSACKLGVDGPRRGVGQGVDDTARERSQT